VSVLLWNGTFVRFASEGVLLPIALVATGLGAAALHVAGPAARRRWWARPIRGVAIGAALGLALAAASWLGWQARDLLPVDPTAQVEALYATLRRPPGPVAGLPLLLLTIAGEEVVFRGLLHDALRRRLGPVASIAAGATIYALANLGSGTWILPAVALLLGAAWAALAERSRGLWVPLLCHAVWDTLVFAVAPLVPA
jgi:uncharacterized protein